MMDHPGTLSTEFKRMRATSGCLESRQVHVHEETLLARVTPHSNIPPSPSIKRDILRGRSSIIRERKTKERTGISIYSYSAECSLYSRLVGPINFDSSTAGHVPASGRFGEKEFQTMKGNSLVAEGQLVPQE
jgi:hypothetical protein